MTLCSFVIPNCPHCEYFFRVDKGWDVSGLNLWAAAEAKLAGPDTPPYLTFI